MVRISPSGAHTALQNRHHSPAHATTLVLRVFTLLLCVTYAAHKVAPSRAINPEPSLTGALEDFTGQLAADISSAGQVHIAASREGAKPTVEGSLDTLRPSSRLQPEEDRNRGEQSFRRTAPRHPSAQDRGNIRGQSGTEQPLPSQNQLASQPFEKPAESEFLAPLELPTPAGEAAQESDVAAGPRDTNADAHQRRRTRRRRKVDSTPGGQAQVRTQVGADAKSRSVGNVEVRRRASLESPRHEDLSQLSSVPVGSKASSTENEVFPQTAQLADSKETERRLHPGYHRERRRVFADSEPSTATHSDNPHSDNPQAASPPSKSVRAGRSDDATFSVDVPKDEGTKPDQVITSEVEKRLPDVEPALQKQRRSTTKRRRTHSERMGFKTSRENMAEQTTPWQPVEDHAKTSDGPSLEPLHEAVRNDGERTRPTQLAATQQEGTLHDTPSHVSSLQKTLQIISQLPTVSSPQRVSRRPTITGDFSAVPDQVAADSSSAAAIPGEIALEHPTLDNNIALARTRLSQKSDTLSKLLQDQPVKTIDTVQSGSGEAVTLLKKIAGGEGSEQQPLIPSKNQTLKISDEGSAFRLAERLVNFQRRRQEVAAVNAAEKTEAQDGLVPHPWRLADAQVDWENFDRLYGAIHESNRGAEEGVFETKETGPNLSSRLQAAAGGGGDGTDVGNHSSDAVSQERAVDSPNSLLPLPAPTVDTGVTTSGGKQQFKNGEKSAVISRQPTGRKKGPGGKSLEAKRLCKDAGPWRQRLPQRKWQWEGKVREEVKNRALREKLRTSQKNGRDGRESTAPVVGGVKTELPSSALTAPGPQTSPPYTSTERAREKLFFVSEGRTRQRAGADPLRTEGFSAGSPATQNFGKSKEKKEEKIKRKKEEKKVEAGGMKEADRGEVEGEEDSKKVEKKWTNEFVNWRQRGRRYPNTPLSKTVPSSDRDVRYETSALLQGRGAQNRHYTRGAKNLGAGLTFQKTLEFFRKAPLAFDEKRLGPQTLSAGLPEKETLGSHTRQATVPHPEERGFVKIQSVPPGSFRSLWQSTRQSSEQAASSPRASGKHKETVTMQSLEPLTTAAAAGQAWGAKQETPLFVRRETRTLEPMGKPPDAEERQTFYLPGPPAQALQTNRTTQTVVSTEANPLLRQAEQKRQFSAETVSAVSREDTVRSTSAEISTGGAPAVNGEPARGLSFPPHAGNSSPATISVPKAWAERGATSNLMTYPELLERQIRPAATPEDAVRKHLAPFSFDGFDAFLTELPKLPPGTGPEWEGDSEETVSTSDESLWFPADLTALVDELETTGTGESFADSRLQEGVNVDATGSSLSAADTLPLPSAEGLRPSSSEAASEALKEIPASSAEDSGVRRPNELSLVKAWITELRTATAQRPPSNFVESQPGKGTHCLLELLKVLDQDRNTQQELLDVLAQDKELVSTLLALSGDDDGRPGETLESTLEVVAAILKVTKSPLRSFDALRIMRVANDFRNILRIYAERLLDALHTRSSKQLQQYLRDSLQQSLNSVAEQLFFYLNELYRHSAPGVTTLERELRLLRNLATLFSTYCPSGFALGQEQDAVLFDMPHSPTFWKQQPALLVRCPGVEKKKSAPAYDLLEEILGETLAPLSNPEKHAALPSGAEEHVGATSRVPRRSGPRGRSRGPHASHIKELRDNAHITKVTEADTAQVKPDSAKDLSASDTKSEKTQRPENEEVVATQREEQESGQEDATLEAMTEVPCTLSRCDKQEEGLKRENRASGTRAKGAEAGGGGQSQPSKDSRCSKVRAKKNLEHLLRRIHATLKQRTEEIQARLDALNKAKRGRTRQREFPPVIGKRRSFSRRASAGHVREKSCSVTESSGDRYMETSSPLRDRIWWTKLKKFQGQNPRARPKNQRKTQEGVTHAPSQDAGTTVKDHQDLQVVDTESETTEPDNVANGDTAAPPLWGGQEDLQTVDAEDEPTESDNVANGHSASPLLSRGQDLSAGHAVSKAPLKVQFPPTRDTPLQMSLAENQDSTQASGGIKRIFTEQPNVTEEDSNVSTRELVDGVIEGLRLSLDRLIGHSIRRRGRKYTGFSRHTGEQAIKSPRVKKVPSVETPVYGGGKSIRSRQSHRVSADSLRGKADRLLPYKQAARTRRVNHAREPSVRPPYRTQHKTVVFSRTGRSDDVCDHRKSKTTVRSRLREGGRPIELPRCPGRRATHVADGKHTRSHHCRKDTVRRYVVDVQEKARGQFRPNRELRTQQPHREQRRSERGPNGSEFSRDSRWGPTTAAKSQIKAPGRRRTPAYKSPQEAFALQSGHAAAAEVRQEPAPISTKESAETREAAATTVSSNDRRQKTAPSDRREAASYGDQDHSPVNQWKCSGKNIREGGNKQRKDHCDSLEKVRLQHNGSDTYKARSTSGKSGGGRIWRKQEVTEKRVDNGTSTRLGVSSVDSSRQYGAESSNFSPSSSRNSTVNAERPPRRWCEETVTEPHASLAEKEYVERLEKQGVHHVRRQKVPAAHRSHVTGRDSSEVNGRRWPAPRGKIHTRVSVDEHVVEKSGKKIQSTQRQMPVDRTSQNAAMNTPSNAGPTTAELEEDDLGVQAAPRDAKAPRQPGLEANVAASDAVKSTESANVCPAEQSDQPQAKIETEENWIRCGNGNVENPFSARPAPDSATQARGPVLFRLVPVVPPDASTPPATLIQPALRQVKMPTSSHVARHVVPSRQFFTRSRRPYRVPQSLAWNGAQYVSRGYRMRMPHLRREAELRKLVEARLLAKWDRSMDYRRPQRQISLPLRTRQALHSWRSDTPGQSGLAPAGTKTSYNPMRYRAKPPGKSRLRVPHTAGGQRNKPATTFRALRRTPRNKDIGNSRP